MAHLPLNVENEGEENNLPRTKKLTPQEAGKLGGRPKGIPNKFSADLKNMILGALHDAGGREYLHKQANVNPTAFMSLVGKVLPTTLVGDPKRPIVVSVTEEERRREVDAVLDAVFGVSLTPAVSLTPDSLTDTVRLTIEHEDTRRPGQGDVKLPPESYEAETVPLSIDGRPLPNRCDKHDVVWGDGEHEGCGLCLDEWAETASATSEPQAAENAEPDDKIVQLSHIKSHT